MAKQKRNKRTSKSSSKTSKKKQSSGFQLNPRMREGCLILTFAASLFLFIALMSYHRSDPAWSNWVSQTHIANAAGRAGAWISDFLLYIFGYVAYIFPIMTCYAAWLYYRGKSVRDAEQHVKLGLLTLRSTGFILILITASALSSVHITIPITALPFNAGGILGTVIGRATIKAFNVIGGTVILSALLLIGITLFTGLSWSRGFEKVGSWIAAGISYGICTFKNISWANINEKIKSFFKRFKMPEKKQRAEKPVSTREFKPKASAPTPAASAPVEIKKPTISKPTPIITDFKKMRSRQPSHLPDLMLLDPAAHQNKAKYDEKELEIRSREVETKLEDFGVTANVVAVHPGPVVTRYELALSPGTKVSKITGLAKDLARSLSVISVRVVEVIQGKSVIGLELPNEDREKVTLQEVLASKAYHNSQSALTLALGKDIAGHPVVVDLAKMPHLLVAGTTGSGKSVGLNAMLLSLLYKSTPEQLRLILIDPKMLELAVYDDIPHLLTPVVTDMRDAASALRWCVIEMERRYRLMAALGVRNIAGFNKKVKDAIEKGEPLKDPNANKLDDGSSIELAPLPQIVVLADEFADMMVVVGKKVETLIARLAQKARAAGIHLILATQRPSVDVITGLIKANIPTRIGFQVSSKIDSRTILDQQGAEQLLGHGDMLYLPPGTGVPVRVHGAFVSDDEVHRVVKDLKQHSEPAYLEDVLENANATDESGYTQAMLKLDDSDGEKDALYDQAVEMVIQSRRVSISSIQRRFKIGYNRAARIVETMENAGVVSRMESNGNREVLAPKAGGES